MEEGCMEKVLTKVLAEMVIDALDVPPTSDYQTVARCSKPHDAPFILAIFRPVSQLAGQS